MIILTLIRFSFLKEFFLFGVILKYFKIIQSYWLVTLYKYYHWYIHYTEDSVQCQSSDFPSKEFYSDLHRKFS